MDADAWDAADESGTTAGQGASSPAWAAALAFALCAAWVPLKMAAAALAGL